MVFCNNGPSRLDLGTMAGVGGGVGMLPKQIPKYEQRLWDRGVSRGRKSFPVPGRASLHFYEGTPGRKMDAKSNVDDRPERKQEPWRDSLHLPRERGRMLVEMWTWKATLVRSQVERRSMFLELEERPSTQLNCVLAFCRR